MSDGLEAGASFRVVFCYNKNYELTSYMTSAHNFRNNCSKLTPVFRLSVTSLSLVVIYAFCK